MSLSSFDYSRLAKVLEDEPTNIEARRVARKILETYLKDPLTFPGLTEMDSIRWFFDSPIVVGAGIDGVALKVGIQGSSPFYLCKHPYRVFSDARESILHEYKVGLELNTLKEDCPNFVYTYGIIEADTPIYLKGELITWFRTKEESIPHLVQEFIPNTRTLKEKVSDIEIQEILSIMAQIVLALLLARDKIGFHHLDLNTTNVLVRKVESDSWLKYPDGYCRSYGSLVYIIDMASSELGEKEKDIGLAISTIYNTLLYDLKDEGREKLLNLFRDLHYLSWENPENLFLLAKEMGYPLFRTKEDKLIPCCTPRQRILAPIPPSSVLRLALSDISLSSLPRKEQINIEEEIEKEINRILDLWQPVSIPDRIEELDTLISYARIVASNAMCLDDMRAYTMLLSAISPNISYIKELKRKRQDLMEEYQPQYDRLVERMTYAPALVEVTYWDGHLLFWFLDLVRE